jgi:hypothetical protein
MRTSPIALFVYNRPLHTQRTVEALLANELAPQSDLVVFSDAAKSPQSAAAVAAVRTYLRTIRGFRTVSIHEREMNAGLAGSIIAGVTALCEEHGRAIVLEDDLVTSPWFLSYMNQGLRMYEDDARVASIHGYCYPVAEELPETFFQRGADCWGWATWARAWRSFETDGSKLLQTLIDRRLDRAFDLDGAFSFTQMLRDQIAGKNDSWAVRWHATCFIEGKYTLYPGRSLVENIGNDASGTHCQTTEEYSAGLTGQPIRLERIDVESCDSARRAFAKFLRRTTRGRMRRMLERVMKQVGIAQ